MRMPQIRSTQLRLTCYFLLILLPLVAVSLFAIYRSQNALEHQAGERSGNALASSIEYLDLTLQGIEDISAMLATDENIMSLLSNPAAELSPQLIYDFQNVVKQIANVNSQNHVIAEISIFHSPSGMMLSSKSGGRRIEQLEQQAWYQEVVEARGRNVMLMPEQNLYDSYRNLDPIFNTKSITFLRLMDLYGRYSSRNILAITISKDTLLDLARHLSDSKNTDLSLFTDSGVWITGTSGKVPAMPEWDSATGDMMIQQPPGGTEKMLYIRAQAPYSQWMLLMSQPEKELRKETEQLRRFIFVIICVSIILALLFSWILYSRISSPLALISKGMKQFQMGNLDVRLRKLREDEFGYLVDSFNRMAQQHQQFIQDTLEHELRLANAELKYLQSQINPHFLYNTLNSIYLMAKSYDASDIEEMVMNLSRFYRLSLSKGVETFSVKETMDHLMYYIRIQQIRFVDRFTVEMEMSEASQPVQIQKLLLQPLVENAILHGLEKRKDSGVLLIKTELLEQHARRYLSVLIADNGPGIEQEKLAYMNEELEKLQRKDLYLNAEKYTASSQLFGLRNVKARLKLIYGQRAELQIDSDGKQGTSVLVLIPLDERLNERSDERMDEGGKQA
jgi:two-component system sensor histidine kinase YesM